MKTKTKQTEELIEDNLDDLLSLVSLDILCAEQCKADFEFFIREFWDVAVKDPLIWNWHMDMIVADLEEIAFNLLAGKPKTDYILNCWPGSSKSSITSVLYPAFLHALNPEWVIITISYGEEVANTNARLTRDIIFSEKYAKWFPFAKIRGDFNKVEHYKNVSGGERISTTPGGALTGMHGSIVLIDDIQNAKKANSQVERELIHTWLTETLPSRKKNLTRTSTIYCQQRLHTEDCTGFLERLGGRFKKLCIPVELDASLYPKELAKYYKDGLAFPERFPREALQELKELKGSRVYNTQFLMNPSSDNDAKIKPAWLKIISTEEFKEIVKGKPFAINFYLDPAEGEGKRNDPSALLACAKADNLLFILAVETVKQETYKLIKFVETFVGNNGGNAQSKIYVEPKSTGPSLISMMKHGALNVIKGADPRDGKEARLDAVVPTIEAGKVILVDNGKWNIQKFLSEVTAANPMHDDQRDVLAASTMAEIVSKPANYGKYTWR